MSKRQFALTVGAYLTGWVIAQAVFLRVWKYVMRDVYDEGYHDMARRMGKSLADELERRRYAPRRHEPRLDCACTECRAARQGGPA